MQTNPEVTGKSTETKVKGLSTFISADIICGHLPQKQAAKNGFLKMANGFVGLFKVEGTIERMAEQCCKGQLRDSAPHRSKAE